MLNWIEGKNRWLGFDDDTLLYTVYYDAEGWNWENIEGIYKAGYSSADEAMEGADEEFKRLQIEDEWTEDDALDAYWDDVAHERMEREKGFID